jgi:4-hydroxythreonine-4-phosphate dehydrogenase
MKSAKPIRIVITTGDADGIGTEVATKALAKLKPKKGYQFLLWRSPRCPRSDLRRLDRAFDRKIVTSWPEALKEPSDDYRVLIDINSPLSPASWVDTTAQASLFGHIDAMVTGPLSKTSIVAAGLKDIGHTGILERVTGATSVFPGFLGEKFNVVLATAHIPFSKIESQLTTSKLLAAIEAAERMRLVLPKRIQALPIGVVGLNPHASEDGLMGSFEEKVIQPAIQQALAKKYRVEGPLVPDAAFLPDNWSKHSVFVACYHDQGLIPFKMIHGQNSGIQVTLGLPIIRTSVDHGTAKDLFGRDKADYRSMYNALDWAIKLIESSVEL